MDYNISKDDVFLFHQGTNYHSQRLLGCHYMTCEGEKGYRFAVWAPHAKDVALVGDFNQWKGTDYSLERINKEGLWVGFFTTLTENTVYKYAITTSCNQILFKSDPYAQQSEVRPATASLTPSLSIYEWHDEEWQKTRRDFNAHTSPISIYEVHLGSWKVKGTGKPSSKTRNASEFYTYRELADELIPYVQSLGFTHIELLPLAEHPFDLSWGYQITGYFSVTSRYGSPNDFKYFVDKCHQANIGVIMDWVPGHFCKDDFGLRQFDGKPLYEYEDPRKAEKRSWGTLTFDFGRPEVQSFLISNALFWLEEYHIDGIRVDAVASMLYLNFDKENEEEKIFNSDGSDDHLEAYSLIRKLNEVVFSFVPHALMMAEDSSDLPLVTAPTCDGGLGFNFKWNMGWMNDTLAYMKKESNYRKWHHNLLTFSLMYTHSENFLLPLSHDEVVHGKKSLLDKMPGDQWQQFANLRLLYGYMFTHPGKKLLFMGSELAQYAEWKDKEQLDWHLLEYPLHKSLFEYVKSLNHLYQEYPEFYELDHEPLGFEWIDPHHCNQSIVAFRRRSSIPREEIIVLCNFTPAVHYDYKLGVPIPGTYQEVFNSDATEFGGSGQLNEGQHFSFPQRRHGLSQHIQIKVPPLAMIIFKCIQNVEDMREEIQ